MLHARDLCKTFSFPRPLRVLSHISLSLEKGESVAICGRSGEGKSTLLHILGTLESPDSGFLEIQGIRCTRSRATSLRRHCLGFIFQSFYLLDDCTALENVLIPAQIARLPSPRRKGLALLESVGLVARADFPVRLLSGGEKQRVAIARALCNDPPLLLADEPSGNLDEANAKVVGQVLFSLVRERGKSLILATHDPELAGQCGRTVVLRGGCFQDLHF